jgi:hypothetical protein
MRKFRIQKHGCLQELIANENGYFRHEGLDYEFGDFVSGDVMGPIVSSNPLSPMGRRRSLALCLSLDRPRGRKRAARPHVGPRLLGDAGGHRGAG